MVFLNMKVKHNFLKGKILSGRVYPEFFPFKENDRVINIGCGKGPQAVSYSGRYKEMVGADISEDNLKEAKKAIELYKIENFKTICANVENIPLPDKSFNKAIAIDIIEHVQNPEKMCLEALRLLKDNGEILITFPAMHDKHVRIISKIGRLILRKKKKKAIKTEKWDPEAHNNEHSIKKWIAIVESCGFELQKSRASTMFPPLHLYGVPKFWFSSEIIHKIDSLICRLPIIKNYGQALVCVFKK